MDCLPVLRLDGGAGLHKLAPLAAEVEGDLAQRVDARAGIALRKLRPLLRERDGVQEILTEPSVAGRLHDGEAFPTTAGRGLRHEVPATAGPVTGGVLVAHQLVPFSRVDIRGKPRVDGRI